MHKQLLMEELPLKIVLVSLMGQRGQSVDQIKTRERSIMDTTGYMDISISFTAQRENCNPLCTSR